MHLSLEYPYKKYVMEIKPTKISAKTVQSYKVEQTSLMYSGAFKDDYIFTDIAFLLLLAHSSGALAHVSEPASSPERNLFSSAAQTLCLASEILLFSVFINVSVFVHFKKRKA